MWGPALGQNTNCLNSIWGIWDLLTVLRRRKEELCLAVNQWYNMITEEVQGGGGGGRGGRERKRRRWRRNNFNALINLGCA